LKGNRAATKLARNAHLTCTAASTAGSMIPPPTTSAASRKRTANFCDYFEAASEVASGPSSKDAALKKLDDLFKKK